MIGENEIIGPNVEEYKGIIGASPEMKKIFETLELIEKCESPVLIEGESGTGKELLAAIIHYNSPRKDNLFVIQNCSTISDELLNAMIFGQEENCFADNISGRRGLLEIADGGTLFLDEIGNIGTGLQEKLLSVLESGTFYREGSAEQQNVNTRIITSTNKGLKKQVDQGLFRKDLFYRINTLHLTMPTLRERKEDIGLLISHFLESHAEIHGVERKNINLDVIELLMSYKWPGNVRELKNVINRMIIISGKSGPIERKHVPKEILSILTKPVSSCVNNSHKLRDALKLLEKKIIEERLKDANWNKTMASVELGISRSSLNNKIVEHNLQ